MSAKYDPVSVLDPRISENNQDIICIFNSPLSIRERKKRKCRFPCSASYTNRVLWKDKTEYLMSLRWANQGVIN